jgi:hypothetical protein
LLVQWKQAQVRYACMEFPTRRQMCGPTASQEEHQTSAQRGDSRQLDRFVDHSTSSSRLRAVLLGSEHGHGTTSKTSWRNKLSSRRSLWHRPADRARDQQNFISRTRLESFHERLSKWMRLQPTEQVDIVTPAADIDLGTKREVLSMRIEMISLHIYCSLRRARLVIKLSSRDKRRPA